MYSYSRNTQLKADDVDQYSLDYFHCLEDSCNLQDAKDLDDPQESRLIVEPAWAAIRNTRLRGIFAGAMREGGLNRSEKRNSGRRET